MKERNKRHVLSLAALLRQLRAVVPPHSLKEAAVLVIIVCLLIGILWAVVVAVVFPFSAAWTIFDTTAFLGRATAIAQGNIVSSDQQIVASTSPGQITTVFCDNIITFQTADGRSITFDERGGSCNNTIATVLYNPAHPSDARTSSSVHVGLIGAYIVDGIYSFLLLTIAYCAVKGWRQKRKSP